MNRILLLMVLLLNGVAPLVKAQTVLPCATSERLAQQVDSHPEILTRMQQIESFTEEWVEVNGADYAFRAAEPIVTIPVVFHVVYNSPAENLSEAQLLSQIDVLNEDFRKLNADTASTLPAFQSLAADIEIEFCLATVAPDGSPTTGIERTATTNTSFSPISDNVKSAASGGADGWPSDQYLNIWVCDIGGFFGGEVIGYATFPGGPPALDGVVLDWLAVGRSIGTATPPYDLGRAGTHEVGHWLNLRHTWGDCLFGLGCCGTDDGVGDTPNTSGPAYGCPLTSNTCSSPDMVQNYMDYSDDNCSSLFTPGQKSRMLALFAPGGPRESLISSPGCGNVVGNCDVPANPMVSITSASSATVSWDPVAGASSYTLQGRVAGAGGPVTLFATSNSYSYSSFIPGFSYEWRVRANCGSFGESAYTSVQNFTMPSLRVGNEFAVRVFPNPADDYLMIKGNGAEGEITISLLDLTGRVLSLHSLQAEGDWSYQLDLTGRAAGLYLMSTQDAAGHIQIERLIVE